MVTVIADKLESSGSRKKKWRETKSSNNQNAWIASSFIVVDEGILPILCISKRDWTQDKEGMEWHSQNVKLYSSLHGIHVRNSPILERLFVDNHTVQDSAYLRKSTTIKVLDTVTLPYAADNGS